METLSTFDIVCLVVCILWGLSAICKFLDFFFFKDRIDEVEIDGSKCPELAGKRYISYSWGLFNQKGIVCENEEVEQYLKSKNPKNKIISYEKFEELLNNKARNNAKKIIFIITLIYAITCNIIIFILNTIGKICSAFGNIVGINNKGIRYFSYISAQDKKRKGQQLSELEKSWLYRY